MRSYDDVKCPVCGIPWDRHRPGCSRHPYRPALPDTSPPPPQSLSLVYPEAVQQASQVVIVAADWPANQNAKLAGAGKDEP